MIYALTAVACLGHLVLMVGLHNWLYGQKLPRRAGKVVHVLLAVAVACFPLLIIYAFSWRLTTMMHWNQHQGWRHGLQFYLAVSFLAGLVWLPFVTFVRFFRKEPVREVRSEVVDVARQLGKPPVGNGHHAFLARLPRNEIFHIDYAEKTLTPARLPAAWDGMTILHLSDLHLHGTPDRDYFRVILDRCGQWNPDFVAVTGDIADTDTHHRWIIPLLGRLRWKQAAFAILGNHDYWQDAELIRKRLRRIGMTVLENNWVEVPVRGEKLVVVGNEEPWLATKVDLGGCPRDPFRLCLSHTPDNLPWARKEGVDLMLSGHVHGGQIRLPVFGSVLVPSACGRRHDAGLFEETPTLLHVSRGVSGEHPVRYNCLPEVTLLTLRSPAAAVRHIGPVPVAS